MIVIVGYLGIGAILFSAWEGWDFISATYFSFITATSIGLGDLVPLKAFSDTNSIEGQIKVIITSAYCIAGIRHDLLHEQIPLNNYTWVNIVKNSKSNPD